MKINKIYNVDAYKAIKEIPDNSIDLIYTDVPYLYSLGGQGKSELAVRMQNKKDEISEISNGIDYSILKEFVRIQPIINTFIWCSKMQIFDILKFYINLGCNYEILTWNKTNPTPSTNNTWLPDIEYCLYFRDKGVKLNDGYELKSKWYTSKINQYDLAKYEHPTIKPLALVERHILHTTQPNQVVFDCFLGSGTTCVGAKNTGRKYLGFEINKKWFDIAKNRLDNIDAHGQIQLF